ncbi:MAG: outer membrane beta-barrel family protein [Balneolaceae bacterium]|nr:outer membrane beta-barrel family protein [Balneolaceae bacterium]
MKKLVFYVTIPLLFWGLFVSGGYAQSSNSETAEIFGTVQDVGGESVPNATVALYNQDETEILEGTSSKEDGSFTLQAEPGNYVLRVSYVSYQAHQEDLELAAGESVDLGTIELLNENATLDEVIVEGERSYMTMNFDSRTFSVGQDITSLGGSALDVLDNVPSITTDFDGTVRLRGNQGVQILINGSPSNLVRNGTDALGSIPANLIKEVEIITNPSARYSAEGTGGIINIKLVDDVRLGFNGSIQANTGYPQDHGLGANLNYHKNNINWFLNFDLEYENDPRQGRTFQSFSGDTTYAYNENFESVETEKEFDINFGGDYYITQSQILTLETRVSIQSEVEDSDVRYTDYNTGNNQIYREIRSDWDVIRELNQNDIQDARENDYDVRLQYENRFEGSDHRLTADVDFEFGTESQDAELLEVVSSDDSSPSGFNRRTFSDEIYKELRIDSDYRQPLGDNGRFEAGFRFNFDWMDNDYTVEELVDGNWQIADQQIGLSDNFTYFENVNALYSTLAGDVGVFNYQLGLRAENTRIQTELTESGRGSDQNYLNLFPSVFLSYSLDEANSFQVSYSRRISRPRIWWILPFTEISDVRNRRVGNPELRPEFGNSYEVGYLRHWETGSILTSLYYRYRTDVTERISTVDNNGITTSQPVNLATEKAWGIEFSADQELFDNLQLMGSLNLFQSDRNGEFQGVQYSSESESLTSRLRLRWRFADGWNFQANAFYRGAQQTTQGRRDGSLFFGGALAKELFNRKATLSLNVRDLFNSRLSDREINNPNSYTQSRYAWSTRSFRLNFRYNFSSGNSGGNNRGGGGYSGR